ncbi:MAG: DUF1579 family protein [Planctomycetota bacterium]
MTQAVSINKHHKRLARFAGVYRGVESISDGIEALGIYRNRIILAGFFAELNYSQMFGSQEVYAMHALIGWSTVHERYSMTWYDSIGGTGSGILGDMREDKLILQGPDSAQGGFTRFTWDFAATSQTVTIDSSRDGVAWEQALQTKYELLNETN